jgi:hypothetical protein
VNQKKLEFGLTEQNKLRERVEKSRAKEIQDKTLSFSSVKSGRGWESN